MVMEGFFAFRRFFLVSFGYFRFLGFWIARSLPIVKFDDGSGRKAPADGMVSAYKVAGCMETPANG